MGDVGVDHLKFNGILRSVDCACRGCSSTIIRTRAQFKAI